MDTMHGLPGCSDANAPERVRVAVRLVVEAVVLDPEAE
jgi:hypothetical protein